MVCPRHGAEDRRGSAKNSKGKTPVAAKQPPAAEFVEYVTVLEPEIRPSLRSQNPC